MAEKTEVEAPPSSQAEGIPAEGTAARDARPAAPPSQPFQVEARFCVGGLALVCL